MNWQGIPYKFISEDTGSTVNLALQSIPRILVDTPTDYTSPIITGIVSLIAGIIPAGIAIWTFKRNAINTARERKNQEVFLENERAEQQRFLKEERAVQIASTEKDRETQLLIAKQNFDMQVLSVNRRQWINDLRELFAEYISIVPLLLDSRFDYLNKKQHYDSVYDQGINDPERYRLDVYRNEMDRVTLELNKSLELIGERKVHERLLETKIKMMLNPKEKWYSDFKLQASKISQNHNSLNVLDIEMYKEKLEIQNQCIESILTITQDVLKYEWERVKKGI